MAKKKNEKKADAEEKENLEESSEEETEEESSDESEEVEESSADDEESDDEESDDEDPSQDEDPSDDEDAEAASDDSDEAEEDEDDADDEDVVEAKSDEKSSKKSKTSKKAKGSEKDSKSDSKKSKAKDDKTSKKAKASKKDEKSDKKSSRKKDEEPKTEPKRPKKKGSETPDAVSEDLRDLFGLADDGPEDTVAAYEPDERAGVSIGALFGLLIVLGLLGGLVFGGIQIIKDRQAELEEKDKKAKAAADEAAIPTIRYGNIAFMASTPSNALILQDGEPIYAKTPSGAWTELRASPSTRVQNIKIEEGKIVKYTLVSEGFLPYEIQLTEYDWVPIPGTGDFEKVYHNIRLEPEERPFLLNCDEVAAAGPAYASACALDVREEIRGREDYERIYDARLTGTLTIESDPPGANIFYLTQPLLKPDGTQATTPYAFTVYGKDAEGVDKKVKITDDLSVRLELEGHDSYIAEIKVHQWKCDPIADPEAIKALPIPEKIEKDAPDMIHQLCTYSHKIDGKLMKPDPEAEKAKEEAAEGEAPAAP